MNMDRENSPSRTMAGSRSRGRPAVSHRPLTRSLTRQQRSDAQRVRNHCVNRRSTESTPVTYVSPGGDTTPNVATITGSTNPRTELIGPDVRSPTSVLEPESALNTAPLLDTVEDINRRLYRLEEIARARLGSSFPSLPGFDLIAIERTWGFHEWQDADFNRRIERLELVLPLLTSGRSQE